MELAEFIQETVERIIEGGKALGGEPVPRENVDPTIAAFKDQALNGLRYKSVKPIGSTGKKTASGDIDLGLDTDISIDDVAKHLQAQNLNIKVNKGLGEISVEFPQYDATGTAQKAKAQVDLMIGPESWTKTQYYGPGEGESKYKGVYVRGLVNAIARVMLGRSVSPARGLFSKDDPKKQYSQDWTGFLTALNKTHIGEPWGPGDLEQPFEKMWAKAKVSFTPEQLEHIKEYFRDFMKSTKQQEPKELEEAPGDIKRGKVAAYGNIRGFPVKQAKTGAQVGQGNIGGHNARNRGKPAFPTGYHIAPAANQFDGGGMEVQDPEDIYEAVMYHGSPDGSISDFKGMSFFTQNPEVAREYSSGKLVGSARGALRSNPTVYKVSVDPEHVLDFRKPGVWDEYELRRKKWNSAHPDTDDHMHTRKWLADSHHDLPQFGSVRTLFEMFPEYDAMWISEGSQGISLVVQDAMDKTKILERMPADQMTEAADPSELQKGIPHLEDLKPEQFLEFLRKFADTKVPGLEISEKVDGSARLTFGKGAGHIWTQTKNGSRKARSDQYPETPMYRAIKRAHMALESMKDPILVNWPEGVAFYVAEVLFSRIPNSIEYGPNVIMIHGVHTADGKTLNDAESKRFAEQIIKPTGGKLSDGQEDWQFEYKRTVNPADFQVDVQKEYETLGQLYQDLVQKPKDKNLRAEFQTIQKQVKEKLVGHLRTQRSAYGPEGGDVEGLVFRDLDSGAMTKLVDKDFFTKLNDFLWQHRKQIDMGGKVGGEWKTGVMQSFRKVVADQVIGDSTAAATNFLKKLVAEYAPRTKGKTPEQHADQTLALYIQENKLMTGAFAQDFQKALMQAFKEFGQLKKEWEGFASEPQSVKLGDKTREYPPEHKERTGEAFAQGEAALAGIKAGLEAASSIKQPLTQKVALLKLFMGHKFDKLVAALGGEELHEADDYNSRFDMEYGEMGKRSERGGKFDKGEEFPEDAEEAMELPLKLYKDKLAQHGIRIGKALGSGMYGTAYDIGGGKVLKVTTDVDEAKASMFLKGKKLKHAAQVFEAFKFPDHKQLYGYPYYGIVIEKLKVLAPGSQEEMVVTSAFHSIKEAVGDKAWLDPTLRSDDLFQHYLQLHPGGNNRAEAQRELQVLQKHQVGEIRDELLRNRIGFKDMHGGNLGQKADGTWAAFDLGSESVSPGQEPPILERGGAGPNFPNNQGFVDFSGAGRLDTVGLDDAEEANRVESVVYEQVRRLLEAEQQGTIGATIGRYQPFHAGHAAILRELAGTYATVLVFVAGQKLDKKNPFPHDLRVRMMELSLPDVWTKLKVFPASIQGKGTGYIPGLVANAANSGKAELPQAGAVDVLVGADRLKDIQTQAAHNAQHQGQPGYYTGVINAQALPDVKNDDDAGRISGTAVREALARDDKESVRKMLDPHLVSSPDFEDIYQQLREALRSAGLLGEGGSAGAMGTTVGDTRIGRFGGSAWSSYNPRNNDDDDPVWSAMSRSPSSRMLQMNYSGVPNDHMPGQDSLDDEDGDEQQDLSKPSDLGEAVLDTIARLLAGTPT